MATAETQPRIAVTKAQTARVRRETVFLLLPAAIILALGALLTIEVRGQDLLPGELAATEWLGTIDNPAVLAVSEFLDVISNFETAPVLFAVLLPVVWYFWGKRALLFFFVSGSLTGLTRILNLADRARPTEDLRFEEIVAEAGVYPSGHVFYGVLVFGMIGYLAFKHMRPGKARISLVTLMVMLAVLMGPSRVIELDHWPADTVGSYLLSIPFLLLLIWIDRHPKTQPGSRIYETAERSERWVRRRVLLGRHGDSSP